MQSNTKQWMNCNNENASEVTAAIIQSNEMKYKAIQLSHKAKYHSKALIPDDDHPDGDHPDDDPGDHPDDQHQNSDLHNGQNIALSSVFL